MSADFSSDFSADFLRSGILIRSGGNTDIFASLTVSIAADTARVTSHYVYLNFYRAAHDLNALLSVFADSTSIPLNIINGNHESGTAILAGFSALSADINKLLNYIRSNNL